MEIIKSLEGIGSSHGGCLEFNTVRVTLTTRCSKVRHYAVISLSVGWWEAFLNWVYL